MFGRLIASTGPIGPIKFIDIVKKGLVLYYDISKSACYAGSGTTIVDLIGNSNATLNNNPTYSDSNDGNIVFDGSNDYLITSTSLASKVTTDVITISMWAYPIDNGVLLSELGGTTINDGWHDSQIEMVAGTMKFGMWSNDGLQTITSSIATPLNAWYNFTIVYNGTSLTAYVNGTIAGSKTFSRLNPVESGNGLYYAIAALDSTSMGDGTYSNMRMGQLLIYNRALTDNEVLQNYNATKDRYRGLTRRGLVLHLDAGLANSYAGSGNTWYDLSNFPTANDATLVNTPTYSTSDGGYFTFSKASSESATVSGTNVVSSTAYTKVVWFNLTDTTSDNNLVSSADGGHFMYFGGTNKMYCGHANWVGYSQYQSNTSFSANTWYHAALTYTTADGMKLYINGVLDSTYTANKTAHTGDGSTNIGRFGAGNFLNGSIAQVLVYNSALSEIEILQNYNSQKSRFGH